MSDLARLLQQYGYGQPNPLAQEAPTVDTSNVLAGMPRPNALANALRVAGAPTQDEHGFLFSNVVGELKFNPWEAVKGFMSYKAPPGVLSTSGDDAPVRNSAEAAGWLGLSGLGLNFAGQVPKNALGIFGGRLAKTADHAALAKAEELAAKGADRREIWDQTGWFQGADGKWRFEIDDSKAKLTPWSDRHGQANVAWPGRVGDATAMPTDKFLDHPELRKAYWPTQETSPGVWFDNIPEAGMYQPSKTPGMDNVTISTRLMSDPNVAQDEMLKTAIHEYQHAVQHREGFQQSGGMRLTPDERAAAVDDFVKSMRPEDEAKGLPYSATFEKAQRAVDDPDFRLHMYMKDAAEVEARNAEQRLRMTPEQRRARPPWETEDTPRPNQRVR